MTTTEKINGRENARPSCRAGEYSRFAELNEGHPLGDDSRGKLSTPSVTYKENQSALQN